jgi:hypothetical protein
MTRIQKITIGLFILYFIWEIVVQIWAQSEETPIIRADLLLIFPILIIFMIISLIQYLRKKTK